MMLFWRRVPCAITKARISSKMMELCSARVSVGQPCVKGRFPFVWIENPPRVVSILRIELPFRSMSLFSFIIQVTGYRLQVTGYRLQGSRTCGVLDNLFSLVTPEGGEQFITGIVSSHP